VFDFFRTNIVLITELWRNADFVKLWIGQTISNIGKWYHGRCTFTYCCAGSLRYAEVIRDPNAFQARVSIVW
jgi:hypothetical protein